MEEALHHAALPLFRLKRRSVFAKIAVNIQVDRCPEELPLERSLILPSYQNGFFSHCSFHCFDEMSAHGSNGNGDGGGCSSSTSSLLA